MVKSFFLIIFFAVTICVVTIFLILKKIKKTTTTITTVQILKKWKLKKKKKKQKFTIHINKSYNRGISFEDLKIFKQKKNLKRNWNTRSTLTIILHWFPVMEHFVDCFKFLEFFFSFIVNSYYYKSCSMNYIWRNIFIHANVVVRRRRHFNKIIIFNW